jgi:hypothetical protein
VKSLDTRRADVGALKLFINPGALFRGHKIVDSFAKELSFSEFG